MSSYEKDLEQFLDAWDRVQQDLQATERLEQLAAQVGRPVEDLKRDLDQIATTLRRIGSSLTRRELVDHARKVHARRTGEGGPD